MAVVCTGVLCTVVHKHVRRPYILWAVNGSKETCYVSVALLQNAGSMVGVGLTSLGMAARWHECPAARIQHEYHAWQVVAGGSSHNLPIPRVWQYTGWVLPFAILHLLVQWAVCTCCRVRM
jgi:hypothetical protein